MTTCVQPERSTAEKRSNNKPKAGWCGAWLALSCQHPLCLLLSLLCNVAPPLTHWVTCRVSTPPKRALSQITLTMALGTHFHRLKMILLVWRAQIWNAMNLVLKKVILVMFPRRRTRITYFVVCVQYARVRTNAYFSRRSDSTHNRTDTSRSFSRSLQSGFGLSSFF